MTSGPPPRPGSPRIDVRVIPRCPQNVVGGERDGRIILRVTAPPVDRAANDAVIALLATRLDLPRRAIRIVTGVSARNKTVEIDGLDSATIRSRLLA